MEPYPNCPAPLEVSILTNPLILKLEQRDCLSDEEKQVLEDAITHTSAIGRGEDIVVEGDQPTESKLLLEGFAGRYKILRDGKRQITTIHVAGDFVDLHGFVTKRLGHSIAALTPCRIAQVPHEALRKITENRPHLTRLLWLHTALDSAIHQQWLVAMGRELALGQTAHLICELFLRLQSVGQTEGYSFRLPLTQSDLGDELGLSNVHVNRTIQALRRDGLITWVKDLVVIEDWERLCEIAEFDPTFLNLENRPR